MSDYCQYIRMVGGPSDGGTYFVPKEAREFLIPIRDEFEYWDPKPLPLRGVPPFRYSLYKICWPIGVGYWWGDR